MLFHGINSRRQSWQLSCKASIICWRTGFSCRGRMCLSTKWRPRALMSTHLFLCPLLLQSKQHKGRGHLCLLISSSAQCHVYPLRSWLGWTVIKYALVHAQILARKHPYTLLLSLLWVVLAVNKSIQRQSVWVPCSLSLFILISSGIIAVAHNEFW